MLYIFKEYWSSISHILEFDWSHRQSMTWQREVWTLSVHFCVGTSFSSCLDNFFCAPYLIGEYLTDLTMRWPSWGSLDRESGWEARWLQLSASILIWIWISLFFFFFLFFWGGGTAIILKVSSIGPFWPFILVVCFRWPNSWFKVPSIYWWVSSHFAGAEKCPTSRLCSGGRAIFRKRGPQEIWIFWKSNVGAFSLCCQAVFSRTSLFV